MTALALPSDFISSALHWSDYIPHDPTPKQAVFCMLRNREALFGGAAGGGKSDALLMGALQYVGVPGYSGIVFRKSFQDLKRRGGLISRSLEWLAGTDAKWSPQDHAWYFPTSGAPSTVAFGYLEAELDWQHYQSAEYQYIAFDELTQHREDDYRYMFSRLRRTKCNLHPPDDPDPACDTCVSYAALSRVPLRMRAATNPGGPGHFWVRKRFDIKRDGLGHNRKRPFIPAKIEDNPYLDADEYRESLSELDPVTREQLLAGDWSIAVDGRFSARWARYFSTIEPNYFVLGSDGHGERISKSYCTWFLTVDVAASVREGPGDAQIYLRKAPSWTVVSMWALTPSNHLLWVDMWRRRCEIPGITAGIRELYDRYSLYSPVFAAMECDGMGIGAYQTAALSGLPMRPVYTMSKDKLVRATDALNRAEQGRLWLPQTAAWLEECEAELFTWTGHPHEPADQIDTLSYAAMLVSQGAVPTVRTAANLPGAE